MHALSQNGHVRQMVNLRDNAWNSEEEEEEEENAVLVLD